jgi:hypothetical protein
MAIALEFIDLIVPISKIREKYPGGCEACLRDHEHLLGGRIWYDEHLFREWLMNNEFLLTWLQPKLRKNSVKLELVVLTQPAESPSSKAVVSNHNTNTIVSTI